MMTVLKQRALQFKWHGLGLSWVIAATILAFAWGLGSAPDVEPQLSNLSAQPNVAHKLERVENSAEQATDQIEPDTALKPDGFRVWEAAPIVSALASDKVKPLTPEFWKISGVFDAGGGRRLIVEYPNLRTSEYLKVGDALPNGAKIVTVDQKSVTVRTRVASKLKIIVLEF